MMALTPAQQQEVWILTPAELSQNATVVWQCMADYDSTYDPASAAVTIEGQLGGTLNQTEIQAALNELNEKNLLEATGFKAGPLNTPAF